jgi:hypothetical protein
MFDASGSRLEMIDIDVGSSTNSFGKPSMFKTFRMLVSPFHTLAAGFSLRTEVPES